MVNNLSLVRVDGDIELPALSLSLSIDMDSWTWQFNATLPKSALPNLERNRNGDPVTVRANINGNQYLLLIVDVKSDSALGASTLQISGRGHSAMLDSPYSPIMTFINSEARTAQQLMADALTINGVSLGWDIDWRITDWLVPAGSWSHQGSRMSAVKTIAGAAGAFIQPDPMLKILRVRPRHPSAPWVANQPAPNIELPSAAIIRESIEWVDSPNYNAVYVSGTTADGVLGHVRRDGSAGDLVAQMVTDALITHPDAARQRGVAVLADAGRSAQYTLNLPILSETGVIEPGTTIRYVDGAQAVLGVVRSVSVSAAMPTARQTIGVRVSV